MCAACSCKFMTGLGASESNSRCVVCSGFLDLKSRVICCAFNLWAHGLKPMKNNMLCVSGGECGGSGVLFLKGVSIKKTVFEFEWLQFCSFE